MNKWEPICKMYGFTVYPSQDYPGKFFVFDHRSDTLRSLGATGLPEDAKYDYYDTIEEVEVAIFAAKIRGDAQ